MLRRLALVAFLVILGAPATVRAQGAPKYPTHEGYITTADSGRLFYRVVGSGPDTVIAIHGGPGVDLESIAGDFIWGLAAHHVLIFYDQRGAGRSELPTDTARLAATNQIADLDAVRRFFKIDRAVLMAHSYGPLLAASYAIAHPDHVARMLLVEPTTPRRRFPSPPGSGTGARLDSAQNRQSREAMQRLSDPASDSATIVAACRAYWAIQMIPRLAEPERTLPLVRSDLCASSPRGIQYGLTVTNRVVNRSFGNYDLREGLHTLTMPVLVIHGMQEAIPMAGAEEWVRSMPDARLLRVPNAAHFSYAEQPEFVWPAIEEFLHGKWPAKAERLAP